MDVPRQFNFSVLCVKLMKERNVSGECLRLFSLSPWVALHRLPVFCIRETELRNDPQLILRLPHELETPLQLQESQSRVVAIFLFSASSYIFINLTFIHQLIQTPQYVK